MGMATEKNQKQTAHERRILRSEAGWLQKALFALGKASNDHEKLAQLNGEPHEPLLVTIDGETYDIDDVTDAMKDAVLDRTEALRVAALEDQSLKR
jgi:hypothetical protein